MIYLMQSCPQRAEVLAETLKDCPVTPQVVMDSGESGTTLKGFDGVMETAAGRPFVMLEDDIEFTSGFENKLQAVVCERPFDVVNFFWLDLGKSKAPDRPLGDRSGYFPGASFCWNQCVYYPEGFSKAYLAWAATKRRASLIASDESVGAFLHYNRMLYYVHVPSLVQHRDSPSARKGGKLRSRKSKTYIP